MIAALLAAALLSAAQADRSREGDWSLIDTTDNNTGERDVWALRYVFPRDEDRFLTLTLRCSDGKPTVFIDWTDLPLPDRTVVVFGPVANADAAPAEQDFAFQKSTDPAERGYRASPEVSQRIVAAIGAARYATVTVYPGTAAKTVGVEVAGTPGAWARVSRHCPVRKLPQPPL